MPSKNLSTFEDAISAIHQTLYGRGRLTGDINQAIRDILSAMGAMRSGTLPVNDKINGLLQATADAIRANNEGAPLPDMKWVSSVHLSKKTRDLLAEAVPLGAAELDPTVAQMAQMAGIPTQAVGIPGMKTVPSQVMASSALKGAPPLEDLILESNVPGGALSLPGRMGSSFVRGFGPPQGYGSMAGLEPPAYPLARTSMAEMPLATMAQNIAPKVAPSLLKRATPALTGVGIAAPFLTSMLAELTTGGSEVARLKAQEDLIPSGEERFLAMQAENVRRQNALRSLASDPSALMALKADASQANALRGGRAPGDVTVGAIGSGSYEDPEGLLSFLTGS